MPSWSEDGHTPDSKDDAPGKEPGPRGGKSTAMPNTGFSAAPHITFKGVGFPTSKSTMKNKIIYTHTSTHYFENGFPDFTSVSFVQGQTWCVWLRAWLETEEGGTEWSSGVGFGAELASMPCQIEILNYLSTYWLGHLPSSGVLYIKWK